jgi:hypothetical protein
LPEVLQSWRSNCKERDTGVNSVWFPYVTGTARASYL